MSSLDPTIVQPLPNASSDNLDVGLEVIKHLTSIGYVDIAADHEARISFGEKKYGQRLKINNGREAAYDAYQECLDFISYGTQAYLEGNTEFRGLVDLMASIAAIVRGHLVKTEVIL